MTTSETAEYIIFGVYDEREMRQGGEVARIEASTYKWGPGNAIEKFVGLHTPKPGKYLVVGPGSPTTKFVWCVYVVAYPDFTIEGTRSGGVQLYGEREAPTPVADDGSENARLRAAAAAALERTQVDDCGEATMILEGVIALDGTYVGARS